MEKMEIALNNNQGLPSQTNKQIEIAKALYHLNQVTSFTIPDIRLAEWSRTLDNVFPELDIEDLKIVILDFQTCELQYNQSEGVQNVFFGLKTNFGGKYTVKR